MVLPLNSKEIMLRVSGYIAFLGSIFLSIFLIYVLLDDFKFMDSKWIFVNTFFLIVSISAIYYSVGTRFWVDTPDVVKALEKENKIIEKKIEKEELLRKLENLEKK